ncbi:hypothetical protein EW146_g73 [Bondarzewia mesenterica]|uniref:AB hydrolase-1 domain-containing protein n=1 Tax=Bondarzewia mesenterica TaxID=1095465 RepID=A0A4V3XGI2_9AGAM|nr:hypothetical protein EW146_g73 [Bondarzewia mesenterica]
MPSFTTPSHRSPSKKSSTLSLRREKDKQTTSPDTPSSPGRYSSHRNQSYFDRYPRSPASSSNSRTDNRTERGRWVSSHSNYISASPSNSWSGDDTSIDHSEDDSVTSSYSFPTFDSTDLNSRIFNNAGEVTPKTTRCRSRTNPDTAYPDYSQGLSYLRISASSSHTQVETPPQTPIDFPTLRTSIDPYPLVIAPVSGVETMDALVDGMNGFGVDDFFMGGGGISGRTSRRKERFHPLYQPPLPTPPPGITLGGGLPRKASSKQKNRHDEDDGSLLSTSPSTLYAHRHTQSRTASTSTITVDSAFSRSSVDDASPPVSPRLFRQTSSQTVAPSISEIIRTYAPPEQRTRSRPSTGRMSTYGSSHGHSYDTVQEDPESEPEPLSPEEEADMISRSSVDSIAEEVRRTLQHQNESSVAQPVSQPAVRPPQYRRSVLSDGALNLNSPNLESIPPPSFYSAPADETRALPSVDLPMGRATQSQAIAQYLRSARLTTLLKLTRSPHASMDSPLNVSLSDLGSSTGFPVVVFLGLGSVRYVMGLYDEMAECLGIRLITIDRWGLGRTDTPKSKSARGIPEWASAVEEVLDLLNINQCSVMAHSAGAPYALSFANKHPDRVRGDVLLLAPWVGGAEAAGYKWLKYVPTGILKTAQAAEWKIQAWMLGKPPTIQYKGIGYDAPSSTTSHHNRSVPIRQKWATRPSTSSGVSNNETLPRPSLGSSVFSDYDDLRDFEGRFDSRSTLEAKSDPSSRNRAMSQDQIPPPFKRKTSRGFLERLKGGHTQPQSPPGDKSPTVGPGRTLKALRSMGSLKGKTSIGSTGTKKRSAPPSSMPQSLKLDVGLGFDSLDWSLSANSSASSTPDGQENFGLEDHLQSNGHNRRAAGRRSVSFGAAAASPSASIAATSSYQAALANALIVASHAESSKGTHSDLLQILNHDQQPWGFSYTAYPHRVRVWYGDKDEKIAENAVRWMERNMGEGRCEVKVVKGADHGLMYRSNVVIEVLETVRDFWIDGA